jgi:isopenicillin N synthase-like dioxygenase
MPSSVAVLDLAPWYSRDDAARAALAAKVDAALSSVGFLLVTGHGVTPELRAAVRSAGMAFFALPTEVKQRYAVTVAGRGWLPPGAEANSYAEGTAGPPDLKESYSVGADQPVGIAEVDDYWFQPNVWPAEVPALHSAVTAYLVQMRRLADDLLELCAVALGQRLGFFTSVSDHPTHTLNLNWYPPISVTGEPLPGQNRIGPHTDFGTVTILDREPGSGGLQIWDAARHEWEDAPYDPAAFTINTGDLLARWSGDRWTSNRHRVLAPSPDAPSESLISLVYFHETNHDTVVHSLQPPIGRPNTHPPVLASAYLRTLLDAITVPPRPPSP